MYFSFRKRHFVIHSTLIIVDALGTIMWGHYCVVSSVGRALICCARGRGFEHQTNTLGLKISKENVPFAVWVRWPHFSEKIFLFWATTWRMPAMERVYQKCRNGQVWGSLKCQSSPALSLSWGWETTDKFEAPGIKALVYATVRIFGNWEDLYGKCYWRVSNNIFHICFF